MEATLNSLLPAMAGVFLSLLMEIPAFQRWFEILTDKKKSLVTIGLIFVASGLIFGLGCIGWLEGLVPGLNVECSQSGAQEFLRILFILAFSSQTTYSIFFKTNSHQIA